MSFKSMLDFINFQQTVRHKARFLHKEPVLKFLNTLLATSVDRHCAISAGKYVWRAQVGSEVGSVFIEDEPYEDDVPLPKDRMKPKIQFASEGRANPKGILCLYVASDKETAMSEMRPAMGAKISLGQFKINRSLKLVNLAVGHDDDLINYICEEPSSERIVKAIWSQIDRAFSEPVTASDSTSGYVPTQIIAELFKCEGFDGIVYKSRLDRGYNIALFDLNAADLVNCRLCSVKSVKFEFNETDVGYSIR